MQQHPEDDALELYAMGTLEEPRLAEFEEHLLICHECQERLSDTDAFIQAIRTRATLPRPKQPFWNRTSVRAPQATLLAGLVCAIAIIIVLPRARLKDAPIPTVELTATRGESAATFAPANAPIRIQLDLSALPASARYQVEIARSDGATVWSAGAVPSGGRLAIAPSPLAAGRYWVRLYPDGEDRQMLREFSLTVK